MLFGQYEFNCTFETKARLPPYKGSTFRGLFGIALKRIVCALKNQECAGCILRASCLYSKMFEPSKHPGTKGSSPHPFVIEPPEDRRIEYSPGDPIKCGFLLFGDFNESLAHIVYAFSLMGELGMGARINGSRARFHLDTVKTGNGRTIFSRESGSLVQTKASVENLEDERLLSTPSEGTGKVSVNFQTPCRFKAKNRLKDTIDFETLVRLMLRRVSSLYESFGRGEPALDYKGLVAAASSVRTVESNLDWCDWERFSNRQKTRMSLGGVTGTAVYEGDLTAYIPLLEFCAKTHIGKQTSFGLGKIEYKD
jgi:hypothetical protein